MKKRKTVILIALIVISIAVSCFFYYKPPLQFMLWKINNYREEKKIYIPDSEDYSLKFRELTTIDLWKSMKIRLFQYYSNIGEYEIIYDSFIVYNKKVYKLGSKYSGSGLTSFIVVNSSENNNNTLVYIYSQGSGEIFDHIGVARFADEIFIQDVLEYHFFLLNLNLKKENNKVKLYCFEFNEEDEEIYERKIADLYNDDGVISIDFLEDLSERILYGIHN